MGNWIGLLAAGIMNGSFAVPMRTAKTWSFYHIWGLFSLLSMMVIPCAGVAFAVPGWSGIIGGIPSTGLLKLVVLGLLWGIAALLYGAAVELLGVALGVSILLGLSIVIGAIVPRILSGTMLIEPHRDMFFFGGLLLMVVGVIVCASAGRSETDQRSTTRFRRGLVVAILGGIGSPLLNIGIQFGISLLESAPRMALAVNASLTHWVAWALFLSAAAIMQTGYCFYRVLTKGEQAAFMASGAGAEFGRVAIMAVAWSVSIFLYATAVAGLGRHGPSIGWPVFMALIVLTSNVWGVILGEWRNRPRARFHKKLSGSALLIGATFLIAQGG